MKRVIPALLAAIGLVRSASAAPPVEWPSWAQDLEPRLAALSELDREDREALWNSRPTVRLAIPAGDSEPDVTKLLQAALDRVTGGGTVVLPRGAYRQSDCIKINHARVRLLGEDASIRATNLDCMAFIMNADDGEISGLRLLGEPTARSDKDETSRIIVHGRRNHVRRTTIDGVTGAGILVFAAQDFVISGNTVTRSRSDGIHVSGGSRHGVVARNRLDLTGDDAIGLVSYKYQSTPVVDILVENNTITNVSWARGISVVGASKILIRSNSVVGTGRAAGIIVTHEPYYNTYGVSDVIVSGNRVEKVAQVFDWPWPKRTGQGSIDLNALAGNDPDKQVRRVLVADNVVVDGSVPGIRLLGGVCDIALLGNRLTGTGKRSIEIASPLCQPTLSACRRNAAASSPGSCS